MASWARLWPPLVVETRRATGACEVASLSPATTQRSPAQLTATGEIAGDCHWTGSATECQCAPASFEATSSPWPPPATDDVQAGAAGRARDPRDTRGGPGGLAEHWLPFPATVRRPEDSRGEGAAGAAQSSTAQHDATA